MKNYIWLTIVILGLSSCKKWLDVNPVSQVPEEELFKTQEGFEEAINGIYTNCTNMNLYGYELSCGFPEVLAQNYTFPGADPLHYQPTANYDYKDKYYIPRKDTVWTGLYHSIVNCNLVLQNVEAHGDVLTPDRKALIKAEALALRGFLHFDLLRLFAPSFKSNPAAKAIPYVTDFTNKVTPLSTVAEVLAKIQTDLAQAKELIRPVDPIVTAGYKVGYNTDNPSTEESNTSLFLQNRRHRMNYYAICGELARVDLYMDKKSDALSNAMEVINSNKFPWTDKADFINPDAKMVDRIMYKELVFAWYIPNMKDTLASRFNVGLKAFVFEKNACDGAYEVTGGGGDDLRYKQWFNAVSGAGSTFDWYELQKYKRDIEKNRHYLVMPAIRLSEMYYIASECAYDTDPVTAVNYLNTVRANRGIGTGVTVANKDELIKELLKEARKEFYGEGQIFYMYKRLNNSIVGQLGGSTPASDKVFVMPLPDNEIEFGNR
jgi:hypothetical protein